MRRSSFLRISFIFYCAQGSLLYGHGFGQDTLIRLYNGSWQCIETIAHTVSTKTEKIRVASYDINTTNTIGRTVRSAGTSTTHCYIKLRFDAEFNEHSQDDIVCTPSQEFYIPLTGKWVHASELQVGDILLSEGTILKPITYKAFVEEPLKIYTLEVTRTHCFFVGRYSILTHNIMLPIAFNLGLSIPFGSAAIGSVGGCFGPIALIGGVLIGGAIGAAIHTIWGDKIPRYRLHTSNGNTVVSDAQKCIEQNDKNDEAQAPGKPTEDDGYEEPKNWDGKKVKHQKNGKVGWPDSKGNVWVPTGPGSKAHGGPHWDVQHPNGKSYDNVYPGGNIRPGKK